MRRGERHVDDNYWFHDFRWNIIENHLSKKWSAIDVLPKRNSCIEIVQLLLQIEGEHLRVLQSLPARTSTWRVRRVMLWFWSQISRTGNAGSWVGHQSKCTRAARSSDCQINVLPFVRIEVVGCRSMRSHSYIYDIPRMRPPWTMSLRVRIAK
jgi:hypothetical protein